MATEAPAIPRLKERYRAEIAPALKDEFGYANVMQIPGLVKIVVNMVRKNKKVNFQGVRGAKEGGITTEEAPIHISNVALIDPSTKKAARAGYSIGEDGSKVRVARPGGREV